MSAPSAGNEQPWQFIVIRQRAILDAIPSIHPYSHMLKEAALAIAVCGDLSFEVYKGFWVQDCSAATQNILIAAHGLGLGAVWLGFYPLQDRVTRAKTIALIAGTCHPAQHGLHRVACRGESPSNAIPGGQGPLR